jgi:hypothetical protein
VSATDEIDVVFLEEGLDYGLAEGVADTPIVFAPARLAFFRV